LSAFLEEDKIDVIKNKLKEGLSHEITVVDFPSIKIKKDRKNKATKKLKLDERLAALKRDKFKCTKCKSKQGLHVHHIIHRKNGGTNEEDNLLTLCELCHAEAHRGEPVYNIMIKKLFQFSNC
jgi:hypothetical protein